MDEPPKPKFAGRGRSMQFRPQVPTNVIRLTWNKEEKRIDVYVDAELVGHIVVEK